MAAVIPPHGWRSGAGLLDWWIGGLELWLKPATRARWCPPPLRLWLREVHGDWHGQTTGDSADDLNGVRRLLAQHPDRPRWLLVEGSSVVRATVQLPMAAIDQMRQTLRYEIDRQTPFAEGDVVYDARLVARDNENNRITVELLAMPKARLQPVLEQLAEFGVALRGIDVADGDGQPVGVNLLEERASLRRPYRWFNLALLAFIVVMVSLTAWRSVANERARADALEASLKAQGDRARAVTLQRERLDSLVNGAQKVIAERAQRTDLGTLTNALAERLPANVYIERMSLQGQQLQLTGQGAQAATLMSWLDANPLWEAPSLTGSSVNAATYGHERFAVGMRLKARDAK